MTPTFLKPHDIQKYFIFSIVLFQKTGSQFEYGDNQRRDVLTTFHMVVNTMNFGILILSKEILILRFKILNGRNLHFYDQKIHN